MTEQNENEENFMNENERNVPEEPQSNDNSTFNAIYQRNQNRIEEELKNVTEPKQRELSEIKKNILEQMETEATSFYKIGELLLEAEKQFKITNNWCKWLKENFDMSRSTANRYINVVREFNDVALVLRLGISKLTILIATLPADLRKKFMETSQFVEDDDGKCGYKLVFDMSRSELIRAIKHYKTSPDIEDELLHGENPTKYLGKKLYEELMNKTEEDEDEFEEEDEDDLWKNKTEEAQNDMPTQAEEVEEVPEKMLNKIAIPTPETNTTPTPKSSKKAQTIRIDFPAPEYEKLFPNKPIEAVINEIIKSVTYCREHQIPKNDNPQESGIVTEIGKAG